jgi:2,4-dienoyl-CoA reductase-like NADH-dependent reductase (Old Yellow Enzyme family)
MTFAGILRSALEYSWVMPDVRHHPQRHGRGHQLDPEHGGWKTVAPSQLAYSEGERVPEELSRDDLIRIKQAFIDSARRAERLGIN